MIKRLLRSVFTKAEAVFDAAFGQRLNPFAWLGALGWYFFWIVGGTGVYLYIFFDTGVSEAYASVEYITHEQWYLAGVMRSLHRYASDALVVVIVLHLLREFSLDRLRGKRFFAWVSGVPLLFFIYLCGISGYWLVWDTLAQYIAIATTEWLDALPFFGEPVANNFLDDTTLSGRFFTLMVYIHIFAPLVMLLLMWVHIQRHAGPRVNPPAPLALGTAAALLVLSIVHPAVSQAPADLDTVPGELGFDWFYLAAYPLLDVIPGGQLWLIIGAGMLFLAILPWLPPARPVPTAVVSLANCNGCARCFDDCPFSAISMVPRSDGKAYETEAAVNAENCVSCGICVGACPTATPFRRQGEIEAGIELPQLRIRELRAQALAATDRFVKGRRLLVFGCERTGAKIIETDDTIVIPLPCVGMLPPSFVDFVLSKNLADGVALAGCAESDCHYRLGGEWTRARLDGLRDPYLRQRVDRARVRLWRLRNATAAAAARDEFRAALRALPKNQTRRRQRDA